MENSDIYEKLAKATSGKNVKLKVTEDELPLVQNLIKDLELAYTIEGNTISVQGKEKVKPDPESILKEIEEFLDEIPEESPQAKKERNRSLLDSLPRKDTKYISVATAGTIQVQVDGKYLGAFDTIEEAQKARDDYIANPDAPVSLPKRRRGPLPKTAPKATKAKITDKRAEAILKAHEASIKKKGADGGKIVSDTMAISDDKFIRYTETVLNEISKINTRLGVIESNQDAMKEDMDERFGGIESKISVLNHLITGNGTPEKGLIIRIDRLEQSQASRTKLLWIAIGAAVVSAVNGFITFFKGS